MLLGNGTVPVTPQFLVVTLPTAVPGVSGSLHSSNAGVWTWEQSLKTTNSPTFAGLTISGSSIRFTAFAGGGFH